MQFLFTALGSYGDVHPVTGLGAALASRGHRVKIITNPYFEGVVTGAGVELVPVGTREEYLELSRHPDLWHPMRGPKFVMSQVAGKLMRPLYDVLMANYVPGETVFCAHILDLASRVAAEHLAAPIASIVYAPSAFWSLYESPRLKGMQLWPRVPIWLKRFQYWISDRVFVQMWMGPELNKLRAELGLPRVKRIYCDWLMHTDSVVALFPDWFGAPQPDWPASTRAVGFPLWDAHDDASLSAEVAEFLAVGTPPIAFSPGSANHEAHQFFATAVEICRRLGRRGILLTKDAEQLPAKLPETVGHFGFVPLSKLLPRTCALVHHGGIGNCAQGLAAGVPHIVRPMSYDQFDNARRLELLGVAKEISVRRFTAPRVAAELGALLESPTVAARCRGLAARCNSQASLASACDALESLAEQRPAR